MMPGHIAAVPLLSAPALYCEAETLLRDKRYVPEIVCVMSPGKEVRKRKLVS
jgi:hypothetical protein